MERAAGVKPAALLHGIATALEVVANAQLEGVEGVVIVTQGHGVELALVTNPGGDMVVEGVSMPTSRLG